MHPTYLLGCEAHKTDTSEESKEHSKEALKELDAPPPDEGDFDADEGPA